MEQENNSLDFNVTFGYTLQKYIWSVEGVRTGVGMNKSLNYYFDPTKYFYCRNYNRKNIIMIE